MTHRQAQADLVIRTLPGRCASDEGPVRRCAFSRTTDDRASADDNSCTCGRCVVHGAVHTLDQAHIFYTELLSSGKELRGDVVTNAQARVEFVDKGRPKVANVDW